MTSLASRLSNSGPGRKHFEGSTCTCVGVGVGIGVGVGVGVGGREEERWLECGI